MTAAPRLADDAAALACHSGHCITCADMAIPMRVLAIDAERGLALCAGTEDDGARGAVEIALVEPVAPGDRLLVHAGVALVRLEAEGTGVPGPAGDAGRAEATDCADAAGAAEAEDAADPARTSA